MSEEELYNDIVEQLSSGNFLQLNGKAINLSELNDYINAQQQEIERLNNIINEFNEFIEEVYNHINLGDESDEFMLVFDKWQELKGVDKE